MGKNELREVVRRPTQKKGKIGELNVSTTKV